MLTRPSTTSARRIGEPPKDDAKKPGRRAAHFKTFDERREAALKKYREVESKFPKTGAAILARLAEGSLLLDKHDADGALAAFNDVKGSPLAHGRPEVKGRALEGIGFAYELKAAATPGRRGQELDDALEGYKELENTVDVAASRSSRCTTRRASSRQGRQGQGEGAPPQLEGAPQQARGRRLERPAEPPFPYLKEVAMDRLRAIDPTRRRRRPQRRTRRAARPQLIAGADPEDDRGRSEEAEAGGGDPHGDRAQAALSGVRVRSASSSLASSSALPAAGSRDVVHRRPRQPRGAALVQPAERRDARLRASPADRAGAHGRRGLGARQARDRRRARPRLRRLVRSRALRAPRRRRQHASGASRRWASCRASRSTTPSSTTSTSARTTARSTRAARRRAS